MMKRKREVLGVDRRYVFKLYPDEEQAAQLLDQSRKMVDLWNALLEICEQRWRDHGAQKGVVHKGEGKFNRNGCWRPATKTTLSEFDLGYLVSELYHEYPEWKSSLSTWSGRRVAAALAKGFEAFWGRSQPDTGPPRYKSRKRADWLPHRCSKIGEVFAASSASGCQLMPTANPRSWKLSLTGIPSSIHARGIFPVGLYDIIHSADADVLWRDGQWWFSVAVEMVPRRSPGRKPVTVEFDLIDGAAKINGKLEEADDLIDVAMMSADLDRMKSEFDQHFPHGRKRTDEENEDRSREQSEISKLSAYLARRRKDFLHVWTARIVARASDLTIIAPPSIKEATRSAHGDKKNWGAAVEIVSALNRHILNYAPAAAIQMLKYKAAEAGIRCDVLSDDTANISHAGEKLVASGKAIRKLQRASSRDSAQRAEHRIQIKENDNEHNQQRVGSIGRSDRGRLRTRGRSPEPESGPEAGQARI